MKEKPKEASRIKKKQFKGYCDRTNCTEWAVYHVFDKDLNLVGNYCRDCSESLVRGLNNMAPSGVKKIDVASFFPPL